MKTRKLSLKPDPQSLKKLKHKKDVPLATDEFIDLYDEDKLIVGFRMLNGEEAETPREFNF